MKTIWKMGSVAAGTATSGEKAAVARAMAVPLFFPVLANTTPMWSS
jgi:hypothetical protein